MPEHQTSISFSTFKTVIQEKSSLISRNIFSSILISFALTENVGRMPANCILIDPPFYSENELVITSVVYQR